jgi:Ser/Thr protein kinase RdoA (MazF antagonist)
VVIRDRFWDPVGADEAARVLSSYPGLAGPIEVRARHRRWLFGVTRCRTPGGEVVVKRQPPMGRDPEQLRWQHRLVLHLADRGIPAARVHRRADGDTVTVLDDLWYEVFDVAAGDDVYAGTDTWEPFASTAHARAAGEMLARLHDAGADFPLRTPQLPAGFVVQLETSPPREAVAREAAARPAVADYLGDLDWEGPVTAAYAEPLARLAPLARLLPRRPLHGDWQTNNLFFAGDHVAGVIDFHQADYDARVLDLAVAVERNCFFWNRISAGADDAYDLVHAAALVAGYEAVAPLAAAERAAFADVLATCQLRYGLSFLDYYWAVEGDREKADWAWHTFVLGHAEWWRTDAGRRARAGMCEVVGAPSAGAVRGGGAARTRGPAPSRSR